MIPSVEVDALDEKINEVASMIKETLDLDLLMSLAEEAEVFKADKTHKVKKHLRIG